MRQTTGKALTLSAATIVGALFVLTACATLQSRTLSFPEEGPNSRTAEAEIAYVGVDRRVYVTDRTGEWSVPVTDVPNVSTKELLFDMPTWSPDGERLAFVGFDSTEDSEGRSTIYVADFAERRMYTSFVSIDNSPFYLAWDPRGERVSFLSTTPDNSLLSLQIVSPNGRGHRSLVTGRPMYFSWSPRGSYIAVHTGGAAVREPTNSKISIIDMADTQGPTERVIEAKAGYFQAPSFSPAGRRFAAAVIDEEENRSLEVYSSQGERLATVARLSDFAAFDWSPTGEQLAFIDGYNSPFGGVIGRFRLLDITGSATTVTRNAAEAPITTATAFFWSPDGSKIAILETLPQPGSDEISRFYLTLSILDTETRQVRRVGPFRPTGTFVTQVVPFFDQYQRSTTPWAPDSSALVISAMSPDNTPSIYLIDLTGEGATFSKVAEGRVAFWRPEGE